MPVLNRMLAISTAALLATTVFGQISLGSETKVGEAAFGDWNDDAPGVKRHIRPLSTVSSECKTDLTEHRFPQREPQDQTSTRLPQKGFNTH
jgi:hypothetical protein